MDRPSELILRYDPAIVRPKLVVSVVCSVLLLVLLVVGYEPFGLSAAVARVFASLGLVGAIGIAGASVWQLVAQPILLRTTAHDVAFRDRFLRMQHIEWSGVERVELMASSLAAPAPFWIVTRSSRHVVPYLGVEARDLLEGVLQGNGVEIFDS